MLRTSPVRAPAAKSIGAFSVIHRARALALNGRERSRVDATPASAPKAHDTMPLTHLQRLEAESIHVLREVVAEAERPVMLYSIARTAR